MPTPSKGPRLGGSPQHERLILANLAQSLFEHGRITTTETKAKRLRPVAEKLITSAKRGTLHSRREVMKVLSDKNIVHKLFAEIGPAMATREGGYTRIVKMGPRKGDNAPMAIIEIITEETITAQATRVSRRAAGRPKVASSPAAPVAEDAADKEGASAQTAAAAAEDVAEGADDASAEPQTLVATDAAEDVAEGADDASAEPQTLVATDAADAVQESSSTDDAPYGEGSHAPLEDGGAAPAGFDIKGNADSMLYHVPGSAFYDRTVAEVWFATTDAAEAAGFSLPKSQQDDEK